LFQVAGASIEHGLAFGRSLPVDPPGFAPELRARRATFVTLRQDGRLRGCVGSAQACRALVADVANNAHGAAFGDKRFAPVTADERPGLEISISLLSAVEPIDCRDRPDLLAGLRPGIDGLILEDGEHRALFLPSVWESLPEPRRFVGRLLEKAGLPADHWSPGLTASRFVATSIGRDDLE
jgi:AmmeMemoRadiSam system protein A